MAEEGFGYEIPPPANSRKFFQHETFFDDPEEEEQSNGPSLFSQLEQNIKQLQKLYGRPHKNHSNVPMKSRENLNEHVLWYVLQTIVHVLNMLIAPGIIILASLHVLELFTAVDLPWIFSESLLTWMLSVWALAEIVFWIYCQYKISQFQQPGKAPSMTPQQRLELFIRCVGAIEPGPSSMERFLTGWFYDASFSELRQGNVEQWLAWAFFDAKWRDLSDSDRAEVQVFLNVINQRLNTPLPVGYNDNVTSMRLMLDPVLVHHRPLLYYTFIATIDTIHGWVLFGFGFRRFSTGQLTYWMKKYNGVAAPDQVPIVFIHGIGVGLAQYIPVTMQLLTLNQPLFFVEVGHVSSRLVDAVPEMDHVLDGMQNMLNTNGFSRAIFCGHSYGTVYVSWAIKYRPSMVASAFLADPIVFLLSEKDTCHNFVYRHPSTWMELALNYFAGRELYISKSLSRHFHWTRNILWAEDVKMRTSVILSEDDSIINATVVKSYLSKSGNQLVDVLWLPKMHHAEFMLRHDALMKVVDRLASHIAS